RGANRSGGAGLRHSGGRGIRRALSLVRRRIRRLLSEDAMDEKWQNSFPVSWDQFHRDARALAWRLHGEGPFTAVVAITRGGLVPAAVVARELGIRVIETVCVASYDYEKQGELQVLKGVGDGIAGGDGGKQVLIVDDLV